MQPRTILTLLRTGRQATEPIKRDAADLTARVVQRSGSAGYRDEICAYLTELYSEIAPMLALEHRLRVTSNLDAGEARSRWAVLRRTLEKVFGAPNLPSDLRATIATVLAQIPLPPAPEEMTHAEPSPAATPLASHSG